MTCLSSDVTVGVWTDYSRPGALAQTLTLSNRDAVALLAFLATLVSIVGIWSWRITRFILFMASIPKPVRQPSLSDQTNENTANPTSDKPISAQVLPYQVILRNSETPTGAALGLSSFVFSKGSGTATPRKQHRAKSTLLGTIALFHGLVFIALSILTSQLVLGRTVISKATPTCGSWIAHNDSDRSLTYNELMLNSTLDADNSVQNCYFGSHGASIFDCEMLVTQSIPFSVSHDASCPFASHVCRTGSAFAMETQNISFAQLGVNSKLADQLYFRRCSTCAPIREELFYVKTYTSKDLSWLKDGHDISLYQFYAGTTRFPNGSLPHLVPNDNLGTSYQLSALHIPMPLTYTTPQTSSLRLRDQLPDGHHGPSLILLEGRGVNFYEKSDDPLWSVHTRVKYGNGTIAGVDLNEAPVAYRMDRNLNIIGCDERVQICANSTKRCWPWLGLFPRFRLRDLGERAASDNRTEQDLFVPLFIGASPIYQTSIQASIAQRDGSLALRASRNLQGGLQLHLEPEQWKTELRYWFGLGTVRLQLDIYKTIERPSGLNDDNGKNLWAELPSGSVQDMLCGGIKFRSPNYTSLSFVGVMVVLVVSLVLIVFSFFEVFIDLLPSKWRGDRVLLWMSSENLVLLERRQNPEVTASGRGETTA